MANIIKHKETGEKYILLGSGFGMYQSKAPDKLWGNWRPSVDEGFEKAVCACNVEGEILWFRSTEVSIIEIDGKSPDQYFD